MSNRPISFKEAIKKAIAVDNYFGLLSEQAGHERWNKKLRNFFDRWLNSDIDRKLWDNIANNAAKLGHSRNACFYDIGYSAAAALFEGDPANPNNFSPKALRSRSDQYQKLARFARSLANHYRGRARSLGSVDGKFDHEKAEWMDNEAKQLKLMSEHDLESIRWTQRQGRGRKFTREHISFLRSLVTGMHRQFGKPYYEACVAIACTAYPQLTLTAEDVRSACRGLPRPPLVERVSDAEAEVLGKSMLEALDQLRRKRTGKLASK